ncbi:hypothetical protein MAPG_09343 [Magnaporthiopsis poae ATCC 64411]|uniref:Calcineurin-like phosphoesterase domain-containing protein n=1 Tax=Magnaporthiopsis poae (strain ATCC 64411 / 73-15) TaxID=644358 RepID=A0A0C4E9P7_MAGP6|nr:hypothetical protein MAPG_09343 [Magnaporthiopsis poae ATCC 64411]
MPQIRFLVISDTHNDHFPPTSSLPPADVVLHCGDLTQVGGLFNYRRALESLASCPAELKLVIPGNHDLSLDANWWAANLDPEEDGPDEAEEPQRARAIFHEDKYVNRGVRLLDEGRHTITLRDGRSFTLYASPFTPGFNNHAFAYARNGAGTRFDDGADGPGSSRIPDDVDVIMTHGPPRPPKTSRMAYGNYALDCDINDKPIRHLGCEKLWTAMERVRPKMHCFGHIHEGHGAQRATFRSGEDEEITTVENALVTETDDVCCYTATVNDDDDGNRTTLLVNAAIQKMHGETGQNKAWVVDMALLK